MLLALIFAFNIVINELAWMGTEVSANDEWIELKNNENQDVSLDGWFLKADDGRPEINLEGEISAGGFCLLERTDDETVAEIPAHLIYKGALENSGENLKLYDNLGNLIDEVICQDGWPAGDNEAKLTMERTSSGEWQTSAEPGGTPKKENSKITEVRPLQIEAPKTAEVGPPPAYPEGVVFNEILPSPEGPDAENEWIELFNQNGFEVDLSGWKIEDKQGKTTTYTFPPDSKIPAFGHLVLSRPETKITLNNNGDELILSNPNKEIIDSIILGKAPLGQSYNKTQSGWLWSAVLTPGAENIIPLPKPASQKLAKEKVEDGPLPVDSLVRKKTAAIGQNNSKVVFTLSTAFIVAIFSAIIILVLKKTRAN